MDKNLISMVIPTRNRAAHVKRLLSYLSRVNCKFPIIIADSSSLADQHAKSTKEVVEPFSQTLNVAYLYFDQDYHFPLKYFLALLKVNTPYAVLCADDDFIIPSSALKCAEFLESHPDYALANGHATAFNLEAGSIIHGKINSMVRYPQSSIEEESPSTRLLHHCSLYRTSMYSVQRTALLHEAWHLAANYNLEFGELAPSFFSLIQGKRANLDILYMVRETHAASGTSVFIEDTFDWMSNQKWSHEYRSMLDSLKHLLVKYENLDSENARLIARHAFWVYLTDRLASNLQLPLQIPFLPSQERTYGGMIDDPRLHLEELLSKRSPFWQDFEPLYETILKQ